MVDALFIEQFTVDTFMVNAEMVDVVISDELVILLVERFVILAEDA